MSNPAQIIPHVQAAPSKVPLRRYRPGPHPDQEIDLGMKTIYDRVDTIEDTGLGFPPTLNGSHMSSGAIAVTGTLKGVATGLRTLSNVIVSIDNGLVPHNRWVSATPSATVPGAFDVAVFKPTSAAVNTPILETVPVTVRWHAWGTGG